MAKTASASSSSSSSSSTVDAVVTVDLYRWHDTFGDHESPVNEAERGEKVTVSSGEFARAQEMTPHGLEKASKKDAATVSVEIPADLSELDDKELLDLAQKLGANVDDTTSRDELVAAVAAAPGGHERPQQ